MKKLLIALAVLPLTAGVAAASNPMALNDRQMDRVTAGFTATSIADAIGLVGSRGTLLTTTASTSYVEPIFAATPTITTGGVGALSEFTSTLFKSVSAAQSSSVTGTLPLQAIPGFSSP